MNGVYKRIKKLRKKSGMNQKEFGDVLGISPQSVSALEKGKVDLNIRKILALCECFNITPNDLLGISSDQDDTDNILNRYYQLDSHGKDVVRNILDLEYERTLDSNRDRSYIYPLIQDKTVEIDYFPQAAGMGRGQDVTPEFPEKIEVSSSDVPDYTDYVIRVTGDSMFPTFLPGDLLFVQKTNHLNLGDIGVFVVDGETVVKEYGKDKLISHNKKYNPITQADSCLIQGRVLGKLKGA